MPTQNAEAHLVRALAPLVTGVAQGLVKEVIVVDAGSSDATAEMADAAGCTLISAEPGKRLSAGAAAARGDWLLFLPPDGELQNDWIEATRRFIARPANGRCAAAYTLASEGRARARLWPRLRAEIFKRPVATQGLLIAAAFYRELGGHRHSAGDLHADLIARIGAKRLAILRAQICV